jgi:putative ABC transport system ATP-binding protein
MNDTTYDQTLPSGGKAMLEALGLCRSAGERVLLDDVSLSIRGGDRIAIVGPTGSGKTLLLRSLGMLDPLDAGEVHWQGTSVRGNNVPKFRSEVIYLHQRPSLVEGTVEDNLRQPFALRVHQHKQFNRERLVELLSSLSRDASFLSRQQRDLSGGELQLTSLLRAIQLDPIFLLLDEPTAALDADSASMVETLVTRWLDEIPMSRATVWVTHDNDQSQRVSTSVLKIHKGKLS